MTTTEPERVYLPGDLILVDFDPALGTEQRGRRPALIVSTIEMNTLTRRIIICPITQNLDPWPKKVLLLDGLGASGAILVDQARSIDRRARTLRFLGRVPAHILAEPRSKLAALIDVEMNGAEEGDEFE